MKGFWNELQRRQIVKSAVAYLVVSWVIIQVLSILFPTFSFSPNALKTVIIILAALFPAWIIFNWIYELSPQGLVKTDNSPIDSKGIDKKRISFNRVIIVGLSMAVVLLVINTLRLQSKIIRDEDGKSSIAVLYFDNMSANEDNAWISDGMTESISTKLEHNKNLLVTGRTSVKQFRDSDETIPEIAKKIGVSYILGGSVRVHNNKAIITAQLFDKNDIHLWAKEYNVVLNDILEIQSTIAGQIVDELQFALSPEEKQQLEYKITDNVEAYKLYQMGRDLADKRTKEDVQKSIEYFQQAIKIDTSFSEAYAEIANSYQIMYNYGWNHLEETLINTDKFLNKAFLLNPDNARAYTVKGIMEFLIGNREKTLEYLHKALNINPNDNVAYHYISIYYRTKRDYDKALYNINKAHSLDPLSNAIIQQKIWILTEDERYKDAKEFFKKYQIVLSDEIKEYIESDLIFKEVVSLVTNSKNWKTALKFYEDAIERDSENAMNYRLLGETYGFVLKDIEKYIEYSKKAYKMDSMSDANGYQYYRAMVENGYFAEAKKLLDNLHFNSLFDDSEKSFNRFLFYHFKKDYLKAQEILDESYGYYYPNCVNLAYLGDEDRVFKIIKDEKVRDNGLKANVFAILKNRDSMYYYLDRVSRIRSVKYINRSIDFDPYRKEERFKAFLKRHYLPLTHWNE